MTSSRSPRHKLLQATLPENASVKLIGLGGIGHILARYLALFLAAHSGDSRLVLIDGDSFEPTNSARMFFGRYGNKAAVIRNELLPRFEDSSLLLIVVEEYLQPGNIGQLLQEGDLVVLTVDNHATRRLVSNHCAQLRDVCLISGGNDGVGKDSSGTVRRGTYGNVQVFLRKGGQDLTPSLTRYHPEIETPADALPTEQSCTELVASVPQILFTNLAVASAMLNTLWLYLAGALHYCELSLDIAEGLMRPAMTLAGPVPPPARTAQIDT